MPRRHSGRATPATKGSGRVRNGGPGRFDGVRSARKKPHSMSDFRRPNHWLDLMPCGQRAHPVFNPPPNRGKRAAMRPNRPRLYPWTASRRGPPARPDTVSSSPPAWHPGMCRCEETGAPRAVGRAVSGQRGVQRVQLRGPTVERRHAWRPLIEGRNWRIRATEACLDIANVSPGDAPGNGARRQQARRLSRPRRRGPRRLRRTRPRPHPHPASPSSAFLIHLTSAGSG